MLFSPPASNDVSATAATAAGPSSSSTIKSRTWWAHLTNLGSNPSSFVRHLVRGSQRRRRPPPLPSAANSNDDSVVVVVDRSAPLPVRCTLHERREDGKQGQEQRQQEQRVPRAQVFAREEPSRDDDDNGATTHVVVRKNASSTSIDSSCTDFSSSLTLCSTKSSSPPPPPPELKRKRRVRFKLTEEDLSRERARRWRTTAAAATAVDDDRHNTSLVMVDAFEHCDVQRCFRFHPLLAGGAYPYSARMSYDVGYAPSPWVVLDPSTNAPIPARVLRESATTTMGNSRLVLRSDMFPWPVVIGRGGSDDAFARAHHHSHSGCEFYPAGLSCPLPRPQQQQQRNKQQRRGRQPPGAARAVTTNWDVLCAVHATLQVPVTSEEWDALGRESAAAQRAVAVAYARRCVRTGGGWQAGVRRVDWLGTRTVLVGIEASSSSTGAGKLIFA